MTTERVELNTIINELPDEAIRTMKEFALSVQVTYEKMRMQAYLATIPEDDEPVTEEDLKAFAESEESYKKGDFISLEKLEKDLGL